jgi:hypothetical protein
MIHNPLMLVNILCPGHIAQLFTVASMINESRGAVNTKERRSEVREGCRQDTASAPLRIQVRTTAEFG